MQPVQWAKDGFKFDNAVRDRTVLRRKKGVNRFVDAEATGQEAMPDEQPMAREARGLEKAPPAACQAEKTAE